MQIVKGYDKDSISEVALMCGDSLFKDFEENIYAQAIFRAQREIAKTYEILHREIEFIIEEDSVPESVLLGDFKAEYYYSVNGIEYTKNIEIDLSNEEVKEYAIVYNADNKSLYTTYSNKLAGDKVNLKYISIGLTPEEYDGIPIIPAKYYEELLDNAVVYVAKLGIAKFGGEKASKYKDVYRIYNHKQFDSRIAKDNSWIQIKPFKIY